MRLIWTPELEEYLARPVPVRTPASRLTWACLILAHLFAAVFVTVIVRWWRG